MVIGEDAYRTYIIPVAIKEAAFKMEPSTGTAPLQVDFDASSLLEGNVKVQSLDWDFDGDLGTF